MDILTLHRIHFAFTITYHYLFPQLTMGLALLIVVLKALALKTGKAQYDVSARFWAKIFAGNFLLGVDTGIPIEFQFGTNWSEFSRRTGGVIGMPIAMEGIFSFFLESAFLGLFLFGENRLPRWGHWAAAFLVFLGSWISGLFIIVANAWMQHPVGYHILPNGVYEVSSFWALMLNPWAWLEYAHNMSGAVITGAFVMSSVGALYLLQRRDVEYGRTFLKLGVIAGLISCATQIFPTGDSQGKYLARHQPAAIRRNAALISFFSSCFYLAAMLAGAAAGLFPTLLSSVGGGCQDVTIARALAGPHTLRVGVVWWSLGMLMAAMYFCIVYWLFRGKVSQQSGDYGH